MSYAYEKICTVHSPLLVYKTSWKHPFTIVVLEGTNFFPAHMTPVKDEGKLLPPLQSFTVFPDCTSLCNPIYILTFCGQNLVNQS